MTAPVFVDTNVFVYAREAGDATRQPRAVSWLEWLWREQLGRTSMQVLSGYYVTVTRKLKPGLSAEQAWDDIDALMAWNPQPIDREVMQRARAIQSRHRLSWWDSLVIAAARPRPRDAAAARGAPHGKQALVRAQYPKAGYGPARGDRS